MNRGTHGTAEKRSTVFCLVLCLSACSVVPAFADTHYVSLAGGHVSPFTNWSTAATTIQAAVDVAVSGDVVLVTNGTYDSGGREVPWRSVPPYPLPLTNRVVITNAILVRSVNGPACTRIVGAADPVTGNGTCAVRCVYVSAGEIRGFTLTDGHTYSDEASYEGCGGGAFVNNQGTVSQCIITSNSAYRMGGGACVAYGQILDSLISCNDSESGGGLALFMGSASAICCVIWSNRASDGGGVYSSGGTLRNCTIAANTASGSGGGLLFFGGGEGDNLIVYYNHATGSPATDNYSSQGPQPMIYNSCMAPSTGSAPVTNEPGFSDLGAADFHLLGTSPCINRGLSGLWAAGIRDPDGVPLAVDGAIDVGAYEYPTPQVFPDITFSVVSATTGQFTASGSNNEAVVGAMGWLNPLTGKTGEVFATVAWSVTNIDLDYGRNIIFISGSNGYGRIARATSIVVRSVAVDVSDSPVHYVSTNGANHWPYTNWTTAALQLQDGVDAANTGDTVWVSNGVYDRWGMVAAGQTNRVAVMRPISLCSVSGPAFTVISGGETGTNTTTRCVYLGTNAFLSGFEIRNGYASSGGGIWCEAGAIVSKCLVLSNVAANSGGAVYGSNRKATLVDCQIADNCAGLWRQLDGPSDFMPGFGGGAAGCRLVNCLVTRNEAHSLDGGQFALGGRGGGAYDCLLEQCDITGNGCTNGGGAGGGVFECDLHFCTITSNRADRGGGASSSTIHSSLILRNWAEIGAAAEWGVLRSCLVNANQGDGLASGSTYESVAENCTVAANTNGGVIGGSCRNSVLYDNVRRMMPLMFYPDNFSGVTLERCCVYSRAGETGEAIGTNSIMADPLFVSVSSNDYRLRIDSPCIDGGTNWQWMDAESDLAGNRRVFNVADIGAYELQITTLARVFLEGPYDPVPHRMTDTLGTNGCLPHNSPYLEAATYAPILPSNSTDWVQAFLVNTNDLSTIDIQTALLDQDGWLMQTDGVRGLSLEAGIASYYLTIKHRNHLAVMSAAPVAYTNTVVIYDFTTSSNKIYGSTNASVELEPGVWGMIAGDADGDGKITATDRAIVSNQVGKTGYLSGDLNLDGVVNE